MIPIIIDGIENAIAAARTLIDQTANSFTASCNLNESYPMTP